jgi:hypothetical protein
MERSRQHGKCIILCISSTSVGKYRALLGTKVHPLCNSAVAFTSDVAAPVAQESNTSPQPLPATSQPPPAPERELIFTKPQAVPTLPEGEIPPTRRQTRKSPSTPERQIPVFVEPTN